MTNVVEIVIEGFNKSKEAFAETEASGRSLNSTLTKFGAIGGLALIGIGVASVKMAADFQTATTRLVTSAGETTSNIHMVSQGMLSMAGQVGMSATELAKGMYTVESAGYHGAAALIVLKAAAQGAKDEGADLGTVANAVTDVLVDYHLKASAAADVTSKMVTAVSYGKTTFQEFSGSMHNILPLASALHLSFADVAGVLAEMTAHGMSADQASQNMANAMRSLMAPNAAMLKFWDSIGISSDEVTKKLGTAGLGGTLQWLSGVAQKAGPSVDMSYTEAFKHIIGTAPGLQVALMTTGENFKATAAATKGISSATADASGSVKGFAEVQKTLNFQVSSLFANLESLAIELGDKLLPAVSDVLGFLEKHGSVIKTVAEYVLPLVGAVIAYGAAMKTAAVAQAIFNAVLDMNPFVAIASAVVILAVVIIKYHTQIWNFIVKTWDDISKFVSIVWDSIFKEGSKIWNAIYSDTIGVVIRLVNGIKNTITGGFDSWWRTHGEAVKKIWSDVWSNVSSIFKLWWNVTSGAAKIAWTVFTTEWKITWDILVGIIKISWSLIAGYFKVSFSLIEGIAKTAWDLIALYVKITWAGIELILKTAWDIIVGVFSIFLDVINGHWHQALLDLETLGKQIWNNIGSYLSTVWNAIHTAAGQIFNNIKDTIVGVFNTIESTIKSLGSTFLSIGEAIMGDLWNGIKAGAKGITSWLQSFAGDIVGVFKSVWGVFSPSRVMYSIGSHLMGGLANGIKDHAHKAVAHAKAAANAVGGALNPTGSGATIQALMKSMASSVGWAGGQWAALNNVEMREAGYNLNARNPSSGAYGLAQFINGPSEYAQYGGNSNTAAGQITAMINYISQRYGNPANAWAHEQAYNWYANGGATSGGFSMVGERGRELVRLPVGSTVIPHGQTESMMGGGGDFHITIELGKSFAEAGLSPQMAKNIRYHVKKTSGGNVQKAFGYNN